MNTDVRSARPRRTVRSSASARIWVIGLASALALWPRVPSADAARPLTPVAPTSAWQAGPALADSPLGQQLLAEYQCGSCHRIDGVSGARGGRGPALVQFGRRSYIAGRLPNTPALLAAWIIDPARLVPGTAMPSMGVTPARARAMAAYLNALR